jgi:two-component system CheB/CheR fusion protein
MTERRPQNIKAADPHLSQDSAPVPEIIELLRTNTAHDFTLYKQATLQRRIERRMTLAGIESDNMERYLEILRSDSRERDLLAMDLLINVTRFFRDPKVFEVLAETIIPELIRKADPDNTLRIWVAGCSTGEEAYSLAILFDEQMAAAKRNLNLQILASDVDPSAVEGAREGLYAEAIQADVSPARLARYFSKEETGYRVLPELRRAVVFTVQDILADPPPFGPEPFDLISCRNLLIYLRPEAQEKVVSFFDFTLRKGGILLLGGSEAVGALGSCFEIISKPERLFRHVGSGQLGEISMTKRAGDGENLPARAGQRQVESRQAVLGDLCRQLVVEAYAPAAVLINRSQECLYSLGPTDRYLCVAPGRPTHDLLAMARHGVATKLNLAIQQAFQQNTRIVIDGVQITYSGIVVSFSIHAQPVQSEGESLLLICFIDEPTHQTAQGNMMTPANVRRIVELELELDVTKKAFQGAIYNLEASHEEQRATNEATLVLSEENQCANEELLASKEELQSLNDELMAVNGQIEETLSQQRTTSNDLQNILYSTDVATLFLDTNLCIRFFTPATKSLFSVISSDVGRPLADLTSLAADSALPIDARAVLLSHVPIEREIEAHNGVWFVRRILPYRTADDGVEGVVITFTDISERKHTAKALEAVTRQAELANAAKSRFLAAASHDLRQPLQTLALLQGLLAKIVQGERAQKLVSRFDETLGAMSGMLNALLDINQIEAGTVRADMVCFPVNDLLDLLRDEFTYHAQAQGLDLRVLPCTMTINSDPRLLEQMLRNLLSNALKYTKAGRVLLGCRRHDDILSIEVWDTGVGIPEAELQAIFEEYHQLDNAARERVRGLGLGLSIVQRVGNLLGHSVRVRSHPNKGSVFAIDVALSPKLAAPLLDGIAHVSDDGLSNNAGHTGMILIVEDDPEVREFLDLLLKEEGHRTATAPDGVVALDRVSRGVVRPDLVLSDYNLPNGLDGLRVAAGLRDILGRQVPVIILTGDISTDTLRDIALQHCVQLNKPVKVAELLQTIQNLLPPVLHEVAAPRLPRPTAPDDDLEHAVIFVVDDDRHIREAIRSVLEDDGRTVEDYPSCEAFLEAYRPGGEACLLIDAYLPGMNGIELLQRLTAEGHRLPAIMITGSSDVPMAVEAMKAGALDFIEKPVGHIELLASVARALEQSRDSSKLSAWRENAARHVAGLTLRQRQIMDMVLAGNPSKNIAADLGISQRTVENHRASIMKKTGSKSLPALARVALAAAWNGADEPLG